jgi:hypothetical protein
MSSASLIERPDSGAETSADRRRLEARPLTSPQNLPFCDLYRWRLSPGTSSKTASAVTDRCPDVGCGRGDPEIVRMERFVQRMFSPPASVARLGDRRQQDVSDGHDRGRCVDCSNSWRRWSPQPATSAPYRSSATVTAARKIW